MSLLCVCHEARARSLGSARRDVSGGWRGYGGGARLLLDHAMLDLLVDVEIEAGVLVVLVARHVRLNKRLQQRLEAMLAS